MRVSRTLTAMIVMNHFVAVTPIKAAGDVEHPDSPAYEIEATYTADVWHNAYGGVRTGSAYFDGEGKDVAGRG